MENGFKETEIGTIPEEWQLTKIEDIFDLQQGKSLSSRKKSKGEPYPFLRTSNTLWGRVDLSKFDYMNFTDEEIAKLRLQPGDLLVCEGGEIGRTAMWRGEIEVCGHQNHVHRLRSREQEVWSEFYMYWMQAAFLLFGLYAGQGIKTTIPNLSGGRLKSFLVPKPSFAEQQKIAKVLSTIQQAIEQQDKILASVRELKKSLMRKLFTEGLGDAELKETEIGMVPEDWEIKPLIDIATLQRGKDLPKRNQIPGPYPIIGSSGILGSHNKYVCTGPGVVTGRSGTIGKLTYIDEDYWPHNTGLYVKNFHGNNPKFVYYLLHLLDFEKYATGVSVPTLNRNFIHSALLQLPPLQIQHEIARILSIVDKKIEVEENRKGLLQELFKTMLHKLMTGQLRVKDLEV